jgi:hypothetical protein
LPDGPGRFPQGFSCPAVLRNHLKENCIFTYGAVTLYGRPFHAVPLTLFYPSFNLVIPPPLPRPVNHEIIVALQPQALLSNRLV